MPFIALLCPQYSVSVFKSLLENLSKSRGVMLCCSVFALNGGRSDAVCRVRMTRIRHAASVSVLFDELQEAVFRR